MTKKTIQRHNDCLLFTLMMFTFKLKSHILLVRRKVRFRKHRIIQEKNISEKTVSMTVAAGHTEKRVREKKILSNHLTGILHNLLFTVG